MHEFLNDEGRTDSGDQEDQRRRVPFAQWPVGKSFESDGRST